MFICILYNNKEYCMGKILEKMVGNFKVRIEMEREFFDNFYRRYM